MKRLIPLLLALMLALALAGCGASASSDNAAAPRSSGDWNTADTAGDDGYWNMAVTEESTAYDAEDAPADLQADGGAAANGKPAKMVYTGYLEMQTQDFDTADAGLEALVKELGGYFQQSSVSHRSGSGYRYGSYTVRVPAAQFETFFQKAGQLCHVTYSSTEADNISESYYDTEARLETARIKLERLQTLLAKATSMEDIITIESAISETEWDIENLSGTLRHYDAMVDYATISVELSEVYQLSGQDAAVTTFGGRLGQSFTNGLRAVGSALEDFAVWLAYSWVWLAVLAVVVVVVIRVVRHRKSGEKFSLRRKKEPQDNGSKPEE